MSVDQWSRPVDLPIGQYREGPAMTSTRPFSTRSTAPPVAIPGQFSAVEPASTLPPAPPSASPSPHLDPPEPEGDSQTVDAERSWRRFVKPVLLTVLAVALGAVVAVWLTNQTETATPAQIDEAIDEAFSSTTVPQPVGPAIYATVLPSLTFIQTGEPNAEGSSIGSGVVINADGNIMTSNHVVEGASQIVVTFADGTESPAQIVQADPAIDIAILQAATLPEVVVPAILGGGVRIGDPVFALGNPLGLGGSFSAGVVSGLDRTLPLPDGSALEQLIQFDAAVNPGSSGGPLVDRSGQLVGIVTAIANPTGEDFFSGIGFAVPIATAGGAAGGPEQ